MLRLIILSGGPKHAAVPLTAESVGVGREDDNAILLDDTFVSRHHAVLVRNGGDYVLRDLGSSNGSFVNDQPAKETPLKPGDRVRFGGTEFLYESIPATESPDAARLAELTRQQEGLTAELSTMHQQLAGAQRQVAEAEQLANTRTAAERKRLEEQLAQATSRVKQLTSELADASAEQNATRCVELTQKTESLSAELAVRNEEVGDLRQLLAGRETAVARLNSELAQAAARVESLEAELVKARAQKQDLTRSQQQAEELTRQKTELSARLAEATKQRTATQERLAEAEADRQRLATELETTQKTLAATEQTAGPLPVLTRQNEELSSALAAKVKQTEKLQRLVAQREAAVAKLDSELTQAAGRVESLEAELVKARAQKQDLTRSQQQAEELTRQKTELSARLAEASRLVVQARQALTERDAELTRWRGADAATEQRAQRTSELTRRNSALLAEVSTLQLKIVKMEEELSNRDPVAVTRLKAELTEAHAALEKVQGEVADARRQIQKSISLEGAGREIALAAGDSAELEWLRAQLTEAQGHLEKTKELESQLAGLTRENEDLADELERVRRKAIEGHQRFAEQVNEEMKKLRRDHAGALVQSASSSTGADDEPSTPYRKGRFGLSWLALVGLCVTALAVIWWLNHS
ncbi:MAG: FHA domain-containing protein [Verrucomicrobiia bacterium]